MQWKALVDSELRARDFASAEAHLGACLRQCPHLGLWGCYIAFVRLTTNDDMARLLEAYELLLDTVGLDVGAVPHWLDYIALLKSNARTEPKLIVRVRGAYQRALMLPLNKLELVWKVQRAARPARRSVEDRAAQANRRAAMSDPRRTTRTPHPPCSPRTGRPRATPLPASRVSRPRPRPRRARVLARAAPRAGV